MADTPQHFSEDATNPQPAGIKSHHNHRRTNSSSSALMPSTVSSVSSQSYSSHKRKHSHTNSSLLIVNPLMSSLGSERAPTHHHHRHKKSTSDQQAVAFGDFTPPATPPPITPVIISPPPPPISPPPVLQLAEGWEERMDAAGNRYYINKAKRCSQWEHPSQPNFGSAPLSGAPYNLLNPAMILPPAITAQYSPVLTGTLSSLAPPRLSLASPVGSFPALLSPKSPKTEELTPEQVKEKQKAKHRLRDFLRIRPKPHELVAKKILPESCIPPPQEKWISSVAPRTKPKDFLRKVIRGICYFAKHAGDFATWLGRSNRYNYWKNFLCKPLQQNHTMD